MSILDCTIYEHVCNDEPVQEHLEGDDDPIVAAALKRQGMKFCPRQGWHWPEESEELADAFDEVADGWMRAEYQDEPGYLESVAPYLF